MFHWVRLTRSQVWSLQAAFSPYGAVRCLLAAWLLKRQRTLQACPLLTPVDLWNAVVGQEDIDIPSLLQADSLGQWLLR